MSERFTPADPELARLLAEFSRADEQYMTAAEAAEGTPTGSPERTLLTQRQAERDAAQNAVDEYSLPKGLFRQLGGPVPAATKRRRCPYPVSGRELPAEDALDDGVRNPERHEPKKPAPDVAEEVVAEAEADRCTHEDEITAVLFRSQRGSPASRLLELPGVLSAGVDLVPPVYLEPAHRDDGRRAVLQLAVLVVHEPETASPVSAASPGVVHGREASGGV